jgi:hypothetical protein
MPDTTFRSGLARLLNWLTCHPNIPIAYVHYADDSSAELCSPAGLFGALTAAADVADALTDATIDITDPDQDKRITFLTVSGTATAFATAPPLEIIVEGSCYDTARTALLASLGAPPVPEERAWTTTAAHLRTIAELARVGA